MSIFDETVEQRKTRLKAEGDAIEAARAKQIATATALTSGINEAYFRKQEELAQQAEEQNKKNAAAQREREKTVNERNAAEAKARIEELHGKVNKPPTGYVDAAGTILCKRNPSISLTPRPDPYPSSDPRNGMPEDLIIRMGMNPDPTQPA